MAHKTWAAEGREAWRGDQRTSDAEILEQLHAARQREQLAFDDGLRAEGATYDADRKLVDVSLSTGYRLSIPIDRIHGLSGASEAVLHSVVLTPGGDGLIWPALDIDVSVPGLLREAVAAIATDSACVDGNSTVSDSEGPLANPSWTSVFARLRRSVLRAMGSRSRE